MPWYVTLSISLLLFAAAPFFRKWIDLVIWPKLSDWWAQRSRDTLVRQITALEQIRKHPDRSDHFILYCWRTLFLFLFLMSAGGTLGVLVVIINKTKHPALHQAFLRGIYFIFALASSLMLAGFRKLSRVQLIPNEDVDTILELKNNLQGRIDILKTALEKQS